MPTTDSLNRITVSTNVEKLGDARIIGILDRHGDSTLQDFQVRLIKTLANPETDVLLVEDSHWKPAKDLKNDVINRIGLRNLQTMGWCHASQDYWKTLLEEHNRPIQRHMRIISSCDGNSSPEEILQSLSYLVSAAQHVWGKCNVSPKDYTETVLKKKTNTQLFAQLRKTLLVAGNALIEKRTRDWLEATFHRHHETLLEIVDRLLEQGKRRIFIIAGSQHGDPSVSRHKTETLRVLEALQQRGKCVILNPDRVAPAALYSLKTSDDSSLLDNSSSELSPPKDKLSSSSPIL